MLGVLLNALTQGFMTKALFYDLLFCKNYVP